MIERHHTSRDATSQAQSPALRMNSTGLRTRPLCRCSWPFSEILRLGAGWSSFLLSGPLYYPIQATEPPRTALGISTPTQAVGADRNSATLRDPMVGEPVAYVQGSRA